MNNNKLIKRAHRLYELEGDYLRQVLEKDPTYAALKADLARLEAKMARYLDKDQSQARKEARALLDEMAREVAFKLGYLYAHMYPAE